MENFQKAQFGLILGRAFRKFSNKQCLDLFSSKL